MSYAYRLIRGDSRFRIRDQEQVAAVVPTRASTAGHATATSASTAYPDGRRTTSPSVRSPENRGFGTRVNLIRYGGGSGWGCMMV